MRPGQPREQTSLDLMALHYLRGLRYLGFTRHSLEEGVEGVEDPGTRGADAQGPEWVDDPGAEEAEDVGTHDVGQVGRKSQRWKT